MRYFQLHFIWLESGMDGFTTWISVEESKLPNIPLVLTESNFEHFHIGESEQKLFEYFKSLPELQEEFSNDYTVDEIIEVSETMFQSQTLSFITRPETPVFYPW